MINFYNNLSPATKLVIQSFLAVLGSVLAGVATAAFQTYTQSGHFDVATIWNVSLATFALLFGKAMHDWIPAHAQQLIQAGKDNEARLEAALARAQTVAATPPALDATALSQQIALNLTNMASSAVPTVTSGVTTPDPYMDPLRVSAMLPVYVPPETKGGSI